jgi:hypothetical protein
MLSCSVEVAGGCLDYTCPIGPGLNVATRHTLLKPIPSMTQPTKVCAHAIFFLEYAKDLRIIVIKRRRV